MAGRSLSARWRRLVARFVAGPSSRQGRGEDGFTLIELLLVLVIIPLVIGAVAIVMITSLRATDLHNKQGTNERLLESHDTQITSSYFVRDVQSSQGLQGYVSTLSPLCSNPAQSSSSPKQLLGLEWDSGATTVSYVLLSSNGSPTAVDRNFCSGGSVSSSVVSHYVLSANQATFTCNSGFPNCGSQAVDPTFSPVTASNVATVEIDIHEQSHYIYTLIASPRQLAGSGPGTGGNAPTLLLANGGNCGTGDVSVNGTAAINYGTLSFQNNNGSFGAQNVYEGVTTIFDGGLTSGNANVTSASGPFTSAQVGEPISDSGTGGAGAIPANTTIKSYTSATQAKMTANATSTQTNDTITIGPNSAISPSSAYTGSTSSGEPITDPYANLTVPFPGNQDTYLETAQFSPATSTITPGIYILQNGLKLTGNTPLTVGPALADGTNGVFFYVTGGSVTIGGTASITLNAITAGPWNSTYGGILLYQIASDTNGVVLDGSSAATTLNGVIAAPGAQITLNGGGNGAGLTAYGLEASSLNCNGNNTTTVLGPPITPNMSLTSSKNPSNVGDTVTFTATVTPSFGTVVPSGSVTFTETPNGGTAVPVCTGVVLNSSGVATCSTSTLVFAGSPYTITATYNPSAGFQTTSATLTQTVNALIGTTTTVASNVNPSAVNQAITYTATVSTAAPGPTPTGTVTFKDGGNTVSCGAGSVAFNGTTATCVVTYTSAGIHSITATYSGDTFYGSSTSTAVRQVVNGMHVSVLSVVATKGSKSPNWSATVTIKVVTDGASPTAIGGVAVTGSWTDSGTGGGSTASKSGCTTATSGAGLGTCTFTTGTLSGASSTWTISGMTVSGYVWDQPSDSSDSVTANSPW